MKRELLEVSTDPTRRLGAATRMIIDHLLHVRTDELSAQEWRKLFRRLTFSDDEGNIYEPWQVSDERVHVPRGAWSLLPDHVEYVDNRRMPSGEILFYAGDLDGEGFSGQQDAIAVMLDQEQGIIVAQPGWGKTDVALAFCAKISTPSLILVHTQDILDQWVERASRLLPEAKIGVIQGKRREMGDVTITTVQTFRKVMRSTPDVVKLFGCVILDEAHHAPALMFDEILNQSPARYRFGFTATDKRADEKHPYMRTVLGPVIVRSPFVSKVPVEVFPLKSHKFYYGYRGSWDWRNMINALKTDEKRNALIAKWASKEILRGNSTLILSREIDHLELIRDCIEAEIGAERMWQVEILAAKLRTKSERREILDRFRDGRVMCVLGTQLADEALDVPILSRVFLTFPGKHGGRIVQQVGRALREHPEKSEARIYDVVDDRVGVLRRQWMERKQAYRSMKIPVRKHKMKYRRQ